MAEQPNLGEDLADLGLPTRTLSALNYNELFTVGDVIRKFPYELLRIPDFGRKSLNLLASEIAKRGLQLGRPAALQLPLVVAAAIKIGEATLSLPPPARHGDLIQAIEALGLDSVVIAEPDAQGFLTSDGRFLGRASARQLVADNGQRLMPGTPKSPELFSEDLW